MPLLEVTVLHARDAEAAASGEADRLLLVAAPETGGVTPDPSVVSAVVRETGLPVRVLLREPDGAEVGREAFEGLVATARTFVELGVAGFSLGFLDRDLEIDRSTCAAFIAQFVGLPWTFSRDFDTALVTDRAWRDVLSLPGVDAVTTAGSTRGLASGGDELVERAGRNPRIAELVLAGGDLRPEYVPWLLRAGVRQFTLAEEARFDRSWSKAYVDPGAVRAWRLLLDDADQRARGVPVD